MQAIIVELASGGAIRSIDSSMVEPKLRVDCTSFHRSRSRLVSTLGGRIPRRCLLLCLVSVSACVTEMRHRPASSDPSNPEAPESKPPVMSTALAPEAPLEDERARQHGHSMHGQPADEASKGAAPDAGATMYMCPMHPEVRQEGPGECPKCGMKLVPEKRAQRNEPPASEVGQHQHPHHQVDP